MSKACADCPCPAICLRWPVFCEQWARGAPHERRAICQRSALGDRPYDAALPAPEEADRIIAEIERAARSPQHGGSCCGGG